VCAELRNEILELLKKIQNIENIETHGTVVDRSLYHQHHTTHDKIQQQYTIVYQKRSQKPAPESPKKVLTTTIFFSRDKPKNKKKW
jgi:hypothetical protein